MKNTKKRTLSQYDIYTLLYHDRAEITSWLTDEEKSMYIKKIEEEKALGELDDCYETLLKLNALSGVASQYSCTGHKRNNVGYLLLRMDEKTAKLYDDVINGVLWEKDLIVITEKYWKYHKINEKLQPIISYTIRFKEGLMEKVVDTIIGEIKNAGL